MPELGKVRRRVRRTKDGDRVSWRIDFYDAGLRGGERFLSGVRGHSFTSWEDANELRKRICHDIGKGMSASDAVAQWRKADAHPNLLLTIVGRWLEDRGPDLAPATLADYRLIVKNHLRWWEGVPAAEVTTRNLRQWIGWMREKGTGEKAIKNAVIPLRGAFRYYREEHPETPEPVWPKIRVVRKPREAMPLVDVVAVLDAIPEDERGVYLACFWAFCRPNEARGLTMGSYDWQTDILTRSEALKTASGANPDRRHTKTGAVRQFRVRGELRAWVRAHRSEARLDRGAPLFPNPRTGTAYSWKALYAGWKRGCEAAGVPYVPVYQALKASVGTALAEAGICTRGELRAAWGHGSEATTALYDLDERQRAERAVDGLESLVGHKPDTGSRRS